MINSILVMKEVLMLDSVTGTQFRKRKISIFHVLDGISKLCLGQLPVVIGTMEKATMVVFGNGLPPSSIRSMDSFPRNYIPGIIIILDLH